jgi:hypothetical protein
MNAVRKSRSQRNATLLHHGIQTGKVTVTNVINGKLLP